jgi:cytochrome bd ubiquinol oxidase subunit II
LGEIRVSDGRVVSGFFAGWTSPFALACGAFAQGLFAFLAAVYLTVDAEDTGPVQEDFRGRALVTGVALAPVAALVSASPAPEIVRGLTDWWAPLLLLATSICAVGALLALWTRRFRIARVAAGGQVTLILLGWSLAQYPRLIVPDVSIMAAAAEPATLRLLVVTLAVGAVVLFPSFGYLFYVFRGEREGRPQ